MAYTSKYNDEKANSPFATRLRTLAEERGASQAKIAEYVGCTYQAIGAYMRGETVPKLTDAQKIAEYFGVSIDYLAGKDECTSPDIQKIRDSIGLSERSIRKLQYSKKHRDLFDRSTTPNYVFGEIIDLLTYHDDIIKNLYAYLYDNNVTGFNDISHPTNAATFPLFSHRQFSLSYALYQRDTTPEGAAQSELDFTEAVNEHMLLKSLSILHQRIQDEYRVKEKLEEMYAQEFEEMAAEDQELFDDEEQEDPDAPH